MKGKSKGMAPKASIANNKGFFSGGNSSTAKGMKEPTSGFRRAARSRASCPWPTPAASRARAVAR